MPYKIRDIVSTLPDFGNCKMIIIATSDQPDCYVAAKIKGKKSYVIHESQIKEKLGEVKEDDPILVPPDIKYDTEYGYVFANQRAAYYRKKNIEKSALQWEKIGSLVPGNKFSVWHTSEIRQVEFVCINFNKPMFVFTYRYNGRRFIGRLEWIVT